ncbi:FIG01201466: hypothetical protein [hydrothermal vent metagenome]|uniref:Uncharacterized protein n=1 Tax=hydrothermal vent metagenome TaxID=652676 RepID=A0A3B1DBH1_9ZZZZ
MIIPLSHKLRLRFRLRRCLEAWAFIALIFFQSDSVTAHELSGFVGGEARVFAQSAIQPGQKDHSASFVLNPEYYHEFEDGSSFTFVPFYRLDSADDARTHFDLRELSFIWLQDDFELRLGVRKVFWGVTEVVHLVDIINQTDLVENVDTEDKLGQPMINLSLARDWGTVDFFMLPFFRERTFPGRSGRLRSALVVDTDRAVYESAAQEWNTDWAVRYSHFFGDWDVGLSHFIGTGREPTLLRGSDSSGNAILIPRYEQINQTGLDVSYVINDWLWKLEALYRSGQGAEDYFSWAGGFEYTFTRFMDSEMDLGLVMEAIFDERGDRATTPFENDIALALRLAVNDPESTEVLAGWVQDVTGNARSFFIEASRRLGDQWKLTVEMRASFSQPESDLFFDQRADGFLQAELNYFF